MLTCSGQHHSRLILGEASFKYTDALITKHQYRHPNLANSIVSSELQTFDRSSESCSNCDSMRTDLSDTTLFCSHLCERIQKLQDQGVTIILGLDATKIHESQHPAIQGRRFSRIHWNCPHNRSNFFAQTLPKLISDFMASASCMQFPGDRIHITLVQPPGMEFFYQGVIYNIRAAATANYYSLYAKRPFGSQRYPGYEHEMTGLNQQAESAAFLREFVFVKLPFELPRYRIRSGYTFGVFSNHSRGYQFTREFYTRATDDESSGYSADEEG